MRLYFTGHGVSYVFTHRDEPAPPISEATGRPADPHHLNGDTEPANTAVYRLDMTFNSCNREVRIRHEDELQGYASFYLGHCPQGILGVRSFGKIVYENIYDDIDLVFRSSEGRMKYEFIVKPGGDVSDIRLVYSGADQLDVKDDGALDVVTPLGRIEEQAPISYQGDAAIASSFHLNGSEVTFDVSAYDHAKTLVIDPWATYYGGSGWDTGYDITTDSGGNV